MSGQSLGLTTYPATRRSQHVDTYHGVRVPDPYRWLEDDSPERQTWIAAQNSLTERYLAATDSRDELRARFKELLNFPRHYDLHRRGGTLFFTRNNGLQSQLVLCALRECDDSPQVLVDPHHFAADGAIRIASFAPSSDGKHVAFGLSHAGSDWQEMRVLDVSTQRHLPDRLFWVKSLKPAWLGGGFYYSRYPAPASGRELTETNNHHEVWYHRIGSPQEKDRLAYRDSSHPHRIHLVQTTDSERLVVLTIGDATEATSGAAVALLGTEYPGRLTPLVRGFEHQFRLIASHGNDLVFLTNYRAPNRRIIAINATTPDERFWQELVAESAHPIENAIAACGKLFITLRVDAAHRLRVFDLSGRFEQDIPLPEAAQVTVYEGQESDSQAMWSCGSFTSPPVVHQYDIATQTSTSFFTGSSAPQTDQYECRQLFFPSRDGTLIPIFIVHKRDIKLDGSNPALVCGYGGGGICMGPTFDPLLPALLERGFLFALLCLRGGGEYGQPWHDAGRRQYKQTVFDDCIAGLEWLQANGYTKPDRTGLIGSSNGGLLVGAVMTQRPDLLAAAVPSSGVLDMLRFQYFTMGHAWLGEYGGSDDPVLFPALLAYSPLHRIRPGSRYPATLVTTSQHDDRVVPAHSFKFVAALQACGAGLGPYLIRIDRDTGHGAVSLDKEIAERADIYAFLLRELLARDID